MLRVSHKIKLLRVCCY